jgi:putative mRNA 3-end processing factor
MASRLIQTTDKGLYCAAGDFYIDPWRAVDRALITHAHSDHARWGSTDYLCAQPGEGVLRHRIGKDTSIESLQYGESRKINDVTVSFHPAGHILGSAQIRVERNGEVWVVSGDYKLDPDPTCALWEPVKCNTFITESTFGLPIYRWQEGSELMADINGWWAKNKAEGKASLLLAYALGKAQRLMMGLDTSIGPIFTHGAVEALNGVYRESGVKLPHSARLSSNPKGTKYAGAMVIAPPSAYGTPWQRQLNPVSGAFASGWMMVRGIRRRRSLDKGFPVSDHCDWPSLLTAVRLTEAENILVTHGSSAILVRHLRELGLNADTLSTQFEGEEETSSTGEHAEDPQITELSSTAENATAENGNNEEIEA